MYFTIHTEEMHLLAGKPHMYQLLYLYMRRHADYQTGLIGVKPKTSLKALCEYLYVEPGPGIRNAGSPSIKQIRLGLSSLEKSALIESRSLVSKDKKQLIFFLPYSVWDYSVQNKVGTNWARKIDKKLGSVDNSKNPLKTMEKSDLKQDVGTDMGTIKNAEVGTHLNNKYIYNSLSSKTKKMKIVIEKDYCPTEETLKKLTELEIIKFHNRLELQKFISYYQSRDTQSCDWDSQYICWLINAKQFFENKQQEKKQDGSKQYPNRTYKPLSAVDAVRARNKTLSTNAVIELEIDNEGRYQPALGRSDPGIWS